MGRRLEEQVTGLCFQKRGCLLGEAYVWWQLPAQATSSLWSIFSLAVGLVSVSWAESSRRAAVAEEVISLRVKQPCSWEWA